MSKLPKVGIYVMQFPVSSETFIVTKVLGLLDAGIDVQIFAVNPSQQWDKFEILKGRQDIRERIHYAPPTDSARKILTSGLKYILGKIVRHPGDFMRLVRDSWKHRRETPLGFLKRIYTLSVFVGHSIDILHIEFDTQAVGVVDVKTFLNCKVLLSARGTFQKTSVLDKFPDAPAHLYRYVDGYHFISEYLRDNTYRLGLNPTVPSWLIVPAIDLKLFRSAKVYTNGTKPRDVLRVITVARLEWQKGYEFAVDAIAQVKKAGIPVEYTIVGTGSYDSAIEFAALQHDLLEDGTVRFVGVVPREEVIRHLSEADVMLHPAVEEGFCNAVIEGQAVGLPVVASDAGGLPENVEDGVTGFVVPRRNAEALAEKLILLARDPDLRHHMGEAGRQRAMTLFDIDRQVERFIELYKELAAIRLKEE